MSERDLAESFFRISSFSSQADGVEVALAPGGPIVVRNSRFRDGLVVRFTDSEWAAFVQGVKNNEFELPEGNEISGSPSRMVGDREGAQSCSNHPFG